MAIADYLKKALRVTSLIFTILVTLNLAIQKNILFDNIEYMLVVSVVCGGLVFLVEDNERYSNRRLIVNQLVYISLIDVMIILGDVLFQWKLGLRGYVINVVVIIAIYAFIKYIMYSGDKKEAKIMNDYLQQHKEAK